MAVGKSLPNSARKVTAQSTFDLDIFTRQAEQIVRNPVCSSSQKRYLPNMKLYEGYLQAAGTNISNPDFSASRKMESNPVVVGCALILARCGPPDKGFEGKKATSTGGAIKSAPVNFWRKRGLDGAFVMLPSGGYTGNPVRSPDLTSIIKRLDEYQKFARTHVTQRAYQQTHEDLRALFFAFVQPQLARAVKGDPSVDYAFLQAACINIIQFATVSRGDELLSLTCRDLIFTGNSQDSPIVAVLPITKNHRTSYTYFRFQKGIDLSICGLSALLGWLCVIKTHGVYDGNIFMQVTSNSLQAGTKLDGSTYAGKLKEMGEKVGIIGLAEHSARRGGTAYQYFVLRRDLFFLYRAFSWDSMTEMIKYIGIEDVRNSYANLGFTAYGTNELYYSMVPNGI